MRVFIDDSGDAGFKLTSGSSQSLVIACCVFPSDQAAEQASSAFRVLKQSLNMGERAEFKFAKTNRDRRMQFVRLAAQQDFFVRAIRFDKQKVYSAHLRNNAEGFYNFAIKTVLSRSGDHVRDARVKLDGTGGRDYKKALNTYLSRHCNREQPGMISNVRLVDSHRDMLIQLADMVAGSVRHNFDRPDPKDKECFDALRKIFRDRRSSMWDFR